MGDAGTERGDGPVGLVVVDKAAGWTSHDVVAKLRGILGTRRVGHAGTLDPGATGVLLVGVGAVTRLLRFMTALPKTYSGEVVLGVETTTLDDGGDVVAVHAMDAVALDDARAAATAFVGDILQVPPMVSAVQVGGRRLHELARAGIEVEREPRPVTVHSLAVSSTDEGNVFRIDVRCSSGTYVRTLAADIGQALGGGAHLRSLRRTAIGSFTLADATPIEAISLDHVLPPVDALRDYPSVTVDAEIADAVAHGKVLDRSALGATGAGPWAVLDRDGRLRAVYEAHRGETVKPAVVLAS
jgi:tRNA pseudouridine55 synthase